MRGRRTQGDCWPRVAGARSDARRGSQARTPISIATAIVLVAVACGSPDTPEPGDAAADAVEAEEAPDEESPRVEEGSGEVDEPPTVDDDEPPTEDDEEPPGRSVIAWLLDLGPSAPSGPSEIRAYEHLLAFDCVGLMERLDDDGHDQALNLRSQSEALYRAVGTACLAAFEDRTELWPKARELAALADEHTTSCLDLAARRLLDDLLDAHDADPTAVFEPATGQGDAQAPPCPRIDRLVPDRGPLDGEVRIEGANFHEDVEVHLLYGEPNRWESDALTVVVDSSTEMRVALGDGAGGHGSVCIALFTTPPDWYADGRMFTLEFPAQDETEEAVSEGHGDDPEEGPGEQQEAVPENEQADATGADRPATTVACPPQL